MKKTINAAAGFALGGILLFFTFRGRNMADVWQSISHADIGLSLISLLLMAVVFILRGARWQLLLREAGENTTLLDILSSLSFGYFVNCITPKLGEVGRCLSLQKNGNVPLAKSFGTVVSERVYDILVLAAGVGLVFFMEMSRLGHLWSQITEHFAQIFGNGSLWYLSAIIAMLILLGILFRKRLLKIQIFATVARFFGQLSNAVKQSFTLEHYGLFLLYTAGIWITLMLLNLVFLLAMDVPGTDLYFAAIVLFISTIGWALPAPGGVGTSHFIVLQLFIAFDLGEQKGLAYGIYSNGITLGFMLIFGLLAVADYFWGRIWREKWSARKAGKSLS